jgi:hypothetical protein
MRWSIRLECEGSNESVVVGHIDRQGPLQAAIFGMSLVESKRILSRLQQALVQKQFGAHIETQRECESCGRHRRLKDYHTAQFQTLFGGVTLRIPRLCRCACGNTASSIRVEGLRDWVSPELRYVQNELAASLPYGRSSELLKLLLPIGRGASPETVRRRIQTTAARLDAELEPLTTSSSASTPGPMAPACGATAIGLDSGYVRHCRPQAARSIEVVVGRILCGDFYQRSVGFVRTLETTSQARHRVQQRVSELSLSTAMTVFSDGDEGLRDLAPQATHVLDWFHLTRYLTIIKQILLGREGLQQFPSLIHHRLDTWLTSMKWRLWHGRVNGALERLASMRLILQRDAVRRKSAAARLCRQLDTLQSYLENNAALIPNYAQRYRRGERISTAFVESAVNQLIDKRMSKSQQMRWSPRGAHAVLQVRAEAVDRRLRADFARWYPGFAASDDSMALAA